MQRKRRKAANREPGRAPAWGGHHANDHSSKWAKILVGEKEGVSRNTFVFPMANEKKGGLEERRNKKRHSIRSSLSPQAEIRG